MKIVLNKGKSSGAGQGAKPSSVKGVTAACPDHLVLADLPVAKSIGSVPTTSRVTILGSRVQRRLGERVHFCISCNFPIAIYGRLNPCGHAFCLDCARNGPNCHTCGERIEKIQSLKLGEGILICGNKRCLKSFLDKADFRAHIQTHPNGSNSSP